MQCPFVSDRSGTACQLEANHTDYNHLAWTPEGELIMKRSA